MNVWERMDSFIYECEGWGIDVGVSFCTAAECAWAGSLRFTADPNRADGEPDESIVFYATGEADPERVAVRLLDRAEPLLARFVEEVGERVKVVGPGEGEVYSPNEVPPGINMSLEHWQALSDTQRQLIGDRRFARPVE